MKIKVFFIRNNSNFYSLATLLASIEDIDDVYAEIINYNQLNFLNIKNYPFEKILFCFSLNTISYYTERTYIEELIKKYKTDNTLFLAGGPHPSAQPDDMFRLGIDIVVSGPGEKSLKEIIRHLKENKPLPKIFRKTQERLDDFPSFPLKSNIYKPIEITRGCPHSCYFCQTSYLFSKVPIHRSIDDICKHIKIAFEKGIKDFRFITPNALGYMSDNGKPNIKAIETLLKSIRNIIKGGGRIFFGTFPSEIRPEYVNNEVLNILKNYVDNKRIHIGLQSGSESMLKKAHRGHTVSDAINAIEYALKANFDVDVDVIFGMPYETSYEMEETLTFIKKYSSQKVNFRVHYFIPLPGSPWAELAPTPLPNEIKKELEILVGKGKLWGAWKRQMEFFKMYETKKSLNNKKIDLKLTTC